TAEFERRFNRPTGLTAQHQVLIALRDVPGVVDLRINSDRVAAESASPSFRTFDITTCLQPYNRMVIAITFDPAESPGQLGGLWQPVELRIEAPGEPGSCLTS